MRRGESGAFNDDDSDGWLDGGRGGGGGICRCGPVDPAEKIDGWLGSGSAGGGNGGGESANAFLMFSRDCVLVGIFNVFIGPSITC